MAPGQRTGVDVDRRDRRGRAAPSGAPVTAVIPTQLARAHLLDRALASVRAQRGVEVDIVVVVNRAAPGARIPDFGDDVVVVERPDASGASAARNAGAGLAGTPWVAFLDDDDTWAPDKISRQLAVAERLGPPVIVGTRFEVFLDGVSIGARRAPLPREGQDLSEWLLCAHWPVTQREPGARVVDPHGRRPRGGVRLQGPPALPGLRLVPARRAPPRGPVRAGRCPSHPVPPRLGPHAPVVGIVATRRAMGRGQPGSRDAAQRRGGPPPQRPAPARRAPRRRAHRARRLPARPPAPVRSGGRGRGRAPGIAAGASPDDEDDARHVGRRRGRRAATASREVARPLHRRGEAVEDP